MCDAVAAGWREACADARRCDGNEWMAAGPDGDIRTLKICRLLSVRNFRVGQHAVVKAVGRRAAERIGIGTYARLIRVPVTVFVVVAEDVRTYIEGRREFRPKSVGAMVTDVVAVGVEEILLTSQETHHNRSSPGRTVAGRAVVDAAFAG